MFYLEDIIELIEDVPDELQRRGGLIQDWERQASEYKREADRLKNRLNNDSSLRDDEKASLFRQISEHLDRARDAAQKKSDMAAKCHRLVQALSERVTEYTYHCKLELEVDAPGCTQAIERNFLNESMMIATAASNSRIQGGGEFRVPEEKPPLNIRDSVASSSMSRESTPAQYGGARTNYEKRTRDSSMSSSRASSTQPLEYQLHGAARQAANRKRKRDRQREKLAAQQYERVQQQQHVPARPPAGDTPPLSSNNKEPPMSSYMRKKKEREREQRKLKEVHANRERTSQQRGTSQQRVIKPEPLDDGYESVPAAPSPQPHHMQQQNRPRAGPGRPRTVMNSLLLSPPRAPMPRHHDEQQPERREEEEQQMDDGLAGEMSDLEDEDLLKFLNEEMPGGIADHDDLNLGLEDENLFDMASFGADLGKALEKIQNRPPSPLSQNIYGTLNAPTKSSGGAGTSRLPNKSPTKSENEKQRQNMRQFVSFGAGESMHGRQRKMTHRADIYACDLESKEVKRRQKNEEIASGEYSGYGRSESRELSLGDEFIGQPQEEVEDNDPYCYCQMPSDGVMVGCEGKQCPYGGWFHLACLQMSAAPDVDKWYCPACTQSRESRRR